MIGSNSIINDLSLFEGVVLTLLLLVTIKLITIKLNKYNFAKKSFNQKHYSPRVYWSIIVVILGSFITNNPILFLTCIGIYFVLLYKEKMLTDS
ncbi:MAG: hypothetical protein V3575_01910 [Candidatus Absconditabacteria bacterium]